MNEFKSDGSDSSSDSPHFRDGLRLIHFWQLDRCEKILDEMERQGGWMDDSKQPLHPKLAPSTYTSHTNPNTTNHKIHRFKHNRPQMKYLCISRTYY
jgi:hypothetical protein